MHVKSIEEAMEESEAFQQWFMLDDFKPLFKEMDGRGESIVFMIASYKEHSDAMAQLYKD